MLVDEGQRDGGQIYRRQPDGLHAFLRQALWQRGREGAGAAPQLRRAARARRLPRRTRWPGTSRPANCTPCATARRSTLPFDALIVCAGATDRLMPVPGLAARRLLQPGRGADRAEGAGLRDRHAHASSSAAGRCFTWSPRNTCRPVRRSPRCSTPRPRRASRAALRGLLARPGWRWRGLAMMRGAAPRRRARCCSGVRPLRDRRRRTRTACRRCACATARGRELRFETDAVALGWHLRRRDAAGRSGALRVRLRAASRQWLPRIDADGRSSVKGVYLAGDGARILGADGAEAAGRLAALAALADLGHAPARTSTQRGRAAAPRAARHGPLPQLASRRPFPGRTSTRQHCPTRRWSAAANHHRRRAAALRERTRAAANSTAPRPSAASAWAAARGATAATPAPRSSPPRRQCRSSGRPSALAGAGQAVADGHARGRRRDEDPSRHTQRCAGARRRPDGHAAAFFLRRQHGRSVTLLERELVGPAGERHQLRQRPPPGARPGADAARQSRARGLGSR